MPLPLTHATEVDIVVAHRITTLMIDPVHSVHEDVVRPRGNTGVRIDSPGLLDNGLLLALEALWNM